MKRLAVIVVVLIGLAAAPGAGATTTADQPFAEWVGAARMPTLPTLDIDPIGHCQELGDEPDVGCTDMESFIALAPGEGPHVFLHEEGHVFAHDYVYGNQSAESKLATLIGHPKLQWRAYDTDGSLDEAFADSFARCGLVGFGHPILPRWNGYSVGSVEITGRRLLAICHYVRSL